MESVYFWAILGFLLGFFLLDLVAEWLNLKALKPEVPAAFRDVYDAESYAKSQAYTRAHTRFGWVSGTFGMALLLGFWLFGGFNATDKLVRGWFANPILAGLAFFGLLYVGRRLLNLPFELYDTFVIEEKFGFNKSTPGVFVADLVKELVLTAVLGIPLGAALLAFFEYGGPLAWLWGWIAITVFSLLLSYLAPSYIMPLFNKFSPLEDGELKEALFNYAAKVQFPLTEISVMDGSKRSTKSNAFLTGFGKRKKIALFDTLIANHSVPELLAVLAHEIGHYKRKHIPQMMAFGILTTGFMFFMAGLFMKNPGLHAAFGMEQVSVYASLLFFSLLFTPLQKVLSVLSAIWSRKNEFEADAFAAETTGSTDPLMSALKRLSKDNLSNLTPHPFYVFLNYSHPPMLTRLGALERLRGTLKSPEPAPAAAA
jgi:STE24 endopeptidase